MVAALQAVEGPSRLADFIAGLMDVSAEEKQALLETFDLKARLDKLLELLAHRIEVLKVSREIDERTRESISDVNRKHLLREQMRQIQKELGEGEEGSAEIAELDKAIAEAHMPEEVEKAARKELKRLERMPEAAGRVLDGAHVSRVADRAAVDDAEPSRRSTSRRRGASSTRITSASRRSSGAFSNTSRCASSIPRAAARSCASSARRASARLARAEHRAATGRKFVRVSLGGVHDEAEIRGHRRTYIGALPGNIIQSMRKAGTRNCVMMLDEVDKLGAGGFHGDPSSALLEVLDPGAELDVPRQLPRRAVRPVAA